MQALDPTDPVELLLAQMTLEEKAGQLEQTYWLPKRSLGDSAIVEPGTIIGVYSVAETRRLQHQAIQDSRLHIPLLFAADVIHGFRTIFPTPLAEASAWDPDLSRRTARAAAQEATASGIHWTYAPMIDISRDPRWGRVMEGAGEDPYLGAALATARVEGFRGPGPPDPSSMMSTAKHFVGYGAAEAGRD